MSEALPTPSRSRTTRWQPLAWPLLLLLGCDSSPARHVAPSAADGGKRASVPVLNLHAFHVLAAATPDAAAPDRDAAADDPQRARGEYLVRHVAGCMECHTPRLPSGAFDETKLLSGVENLADVEPDDPERGAIHSRNLTPDEETGLGKFSDEQVKRAFQRGLDEESTVLHWMMPYWIFRNMSDEDADAIVAFLRSIPPIAHKLPPNQPNAVDLRQPYAPYALPLEQLPQPSAASAAERDSLERGRYLATAVAPCLLCHTPPSTDAAIPIDISRAWSGRRKFIPVRLGSQDSLPDKVPLIDSFNLTPHATGLAGWTATDVANVLRMGVGRTGLPVCDPMPSNTGSTFRGMSQRDALDLGTYFTHLPPHDSGVINPCCTACHGNMGDDAGNADAGGF